MTHRHRARQMLLAGAAIGLLASPAAAQWRCPDEGTKVEMMEIDPTVHGTLAEIRQLRDSHPQSLRRRSETWTYGKAPAEKAEPPVCAVSIVRPTGSGTSSSVNLDAGLLPVIEDPNNDQVFRQLATQLMQPNTTLASLRTPIVRMGDPMVTSDAMASTLTRLGLMPRRQPAMPEGMPMVSDHLLWRLDVASIEVEHDGRAAARPATRFRRCEAEVLGAKVKVSTFWIDNATGALLRRELDVPGMRNPITGRCNTLPLSVGSASGITAIRLSLPEPPAATAGPAGGSRGR